MELFNGVRIKAAEKETLPLDEGYPNCAGCYKWDPREGCKGHCITPKVSEVEGELILTHFIWVEDKEEV